MDVLDKTLTYHIENKGFTFAVANTFCFISCTYKLQARLTGILVKKEATSHKTSSSSTLTIKFLIKSANSKELFCILIS